MTRLFLWVIAGLLLVVGLVYPYVKLYQLESEYDQHIRRINGIVRV